MTSELENTDSAFPEQVEESTYSKDYWDLVLEQLAQRRLFKGGMAVLAILYGLAIFAPLIGNDRPYKLVAIDYSEYARATRAIGTLSTMIEPPIRIGRIDAKSVMTGIIEFLRACL